MIMPIAEEALQEAALRLAWYSKAYGGIPAVELMKLQLSANGLRHDAEAAELLEEANSIRDYLLQICASST